MSTSQANIISVIHEYEILYTTRIQQKSKNWNDGKLTFYEFNKKMEIHNEDGMLLATDFYKSKLISNILNSVLTNNNEFRLPNSNYLIQIQEKIRVFEREVSIRAKTSDSQQLEKSIIKNGSISNGGNIISKTPSLGLASTSHRKITPRNLVITDSKNQSSYINKNVTKLVYSSMGVTRMDKAHSPKNNTTQNIANPSSLESNRNKVQSAPKPLRYQSSSNMIGTTRQVSRTSVGSKIARNKVHTSELLNIDSKVSKRLTFRIPPRTSTYFQYIYTPRNEIERYDVAANDVSIYKPLVISGNEPSEPGEELIQEEMNGQESKEDGENQETDKSVHNTSEKEIRNDSTPNQLKLADGYITTDSVTFSGTETSQFPVKKEQPLIVSNTTVDDADIVYDLSDYEENEKFNAMIKQIKQTQNEEESSFKGITNKKSNKIKTGTEAVEFCLSTDSEMDEI